MVAVGKRQQLLADVVAVLRKKFLTQPTWSEGSPFSMLDSPTAGCQAQWLLKSRNTSQTRAMGASITAERVTRITRGASCEGIRLLCAYLRNRLCSASKPAWKTP